MDLLVRCVAASELLFRLHVSRDECREHGSVIDLPVLETRRVTPDSPKVILESGIEDGRLVLLRGIERQSLLHPVATITSNRSSNRAGDDGRSRDVVCTLVDVRVRCLCRCVRWVEERCCDLHVRRPGERSCRTNEASPLLSDQLRLSVEPLNLVTGIVHIIRLREAVVEWERTDTAERPE